jgi:hypothetical protein
MAENFHHITQKKLIFFFFEECRRVPSNGKMKRQRFERFTKKSTMNC